MKRANFPESWLSSSVESFCRTTTSTTYLMLLVCQRKRSFTLLHWFVACVACLCLSCWLDTHLHSYSLCVCSPRPGCGDFCFPVHGHVLVHRRVPDLGLGILRRGYLCMPARAFCQHLRFVTPDQCMHTVHQKEKQAELQDAIYHLVCWTSWSYRIRAGAPLCNTCPLPVCTTRVQGG